MKMSEAKKEWDKAAKENWRLAREWDAAGKPEMAEAARERAIDAEKSRDSWWYRTFGW
jgi:hypothetical protein